VPHSVRKGKGAKPWKIVKKLPGGRTRTVGSSKTKSAAKASARIRDAAHKK